MFAHHVGSILDKYYGAMVKFSPSPLDRASGARYGTVHRGTATSIPKIDPPWDHLGSIRISLPLVRRTYNDGTLTLIIPICCERMIEPGL